MMIPPQENSPTTLRFAIAVPVLMAASFANLQFLPVWSEFADPRSANSFFLPEPTLGEFMAALVAYAILTVIALCGYKLACRSWSRGAKRLFAALLCLSLLNPLTLNGLILFDRVYFLPFRELLAGIWFPALITVITAFLAAAVWARPETVLRAFRAGLLVLSPFAVIAIGNAAWAVISVPERTVQEKVFQREAYKLAPSQRVLWIIFDELDQHAVFEAPPKGFSFPALKRFYEESFVATQVTQAGANTITAVPGMTTGRGIARSRSINTDTLSLQFAKTDEEGADWKLTPNLFTTARERGIRTGIIGWYFPYCRLFATVLQTCHQIHMGTTRLEDIAPIGRAILGKLSAINPLYRRNNAIAAYGLALRKAKVLALDKTLDLILVHVPLPHQPVIWDQKKNNFTGLNFKSLGYFDNVIATDKFFDGVRQSMERFGLWDQTAVIVSADHGWRGAAKDSPKTDHDRIPLIVKLPGRQGAFVYKKPLGATFVKDMILSLAASRITSTVELAQWLDGKAAGRQ